MSVLTSGKHLEPLRSRFETRGRGLKNGFDRGAEAFKHSIFEYSTFSQNQ